MGVVTSLHPYNTENIYPLSTFPVTSKVAVRRCPAAQAARQWISFNDVSDGVAPSFTIGEAADPTRRTSLDNFPDGVVSQFHDSHTRTPAF